MTDPRISWLCHAVVSGLMVYSQHYAHQVMCRPTPRKNDIEFILCHDSPKVIEEYPRDPRGSCSLIWGMVESDGQVGHIVCSDPPNPRIITAYFPRETQPWAWTDNYRIRN